LVDPTGNFIEFLQAGFAKSFSALPVDNDESRFGKDFDML
jgi:hypothetical protein